MKIFNLTHNADGSVAGWDTLPDSVMLRSGKVLFLPDSGEEYVLCPTLCLRIGRLGKRIAAKFAGRYIDGMAPAVRVIPAGILRQIADGATPPAPLTVFDGALMLGDFSDTMPDEDEDITVALEVTTPLRGATATETLRIIREGAAGASETAVRSQHDTARRAASSIEAVSRYNTVKTGDLLLLGIDSAETVNARIGDSVTARLCGDALLRFRIR